ncbi:MAG: hypothetical protein ACREV4_07670 [Gammaproteobacteria bacterium]
MVKLYNLLFLYGYVSVAGTAIGSPAEDAAPVSGDPRSYLEFVANLDGKRTILSAGGRLQSIKNNHRSKTIRYRLIRHIAGKPQPSFTAGSVGPAGQTSALGCDQVDGQDQSWRLESARYVD